MRKKHSWDFKLNHTKGNENLLLFLTLPEIHCSCFGTKGISPYPEVEGSLLLKVPTYCLVIYSLVYYSVTTINDVKLIVNVCSSWSEESVFLIHKQVVLSIYILFKYNEIIHSCYSFTFTWKKKKTLSKSLV